MELLPAVYEVKFHFFEKHLPKLPNGKYDGMNLIKFLSEDGDDIKTEKVSEEPSENKKSPYSELANELSDEL